MKNELISIQIKKCSTVVKVFYIVTTVCHYQHVINSRVHPAFQPQEVPRVVRQFHFHRWPDASPVPNTKASLLDLLENVDTWQKQFQNTPVTVHCM